MQKTLVVAGGGAAGFFCALTAARLNPQLRVVIVEKTGKLLSKVKVSGGGRCNVTHACFSIPDMIRKYPRGGSFLKKTFHQFFTTDTIQWFEERGVKLKQEADGRMFPVSNSSQTIVDCLMKEASEYGVEIRLHHEIKTISTAEPGARFTVYFSNEWVLAADFICIASGGYPKSSMFEWIRQTGHTVEDPVPSLFTFNMPENSITKLMGVSVADARVKVAGTTLKEQGPLLITHWGMSGPAILKLSAWGALLLKEKNYQFSLSVNWLPEDHEQSLQEKLRLIRQESGAKKIIPRNPLNLPQRLWEWIIQQTGIGDIHWADLPLVLQNKLIQNLCNQSFAVDGKTTFKEEFVTAGGVRIQEINPATLESRVLPGLFFAGEVMDIDGVTGGFNFQHAWTSGFIAGKNVAAHQL
jgi:predicted Rossmann fold flavoprotein